MTNLSLRSDADQLNMYLTGKGAATLTDALAAKLERLLHVSNLLARDKSVPVVAKKLTKLWPGECCLATAYNLIGEAQEVFATEALQNRSFYVNALLADVAQTRKMAEASQDLKVMATCDKTLASIMKDFMGSNEAMPIDKLQAPNMLFSYSPELVGAPLPANWEQEAERIKRKRRTGVVTDHADFQDAQILDETAVPGTPPAVVDIAPKK